MSEGAPDGLKRLIADAAESILREASARAPDVADCAIVALGWATVDLERAATEIETALRSEAVPVAGARALPRDALLGAKALGIDASGLVPGLLLLEADTEGVLAASLARRGEGPAALYVRPATGQSPVAQWRRARGDAAAIVSPAADGPLGAGRLLLGGPRWGFHVVVVEPGSTTIDR